KREPRGRVARYDVVVEYHFAAGGLDRGPGVSARGEGRWRRELSRERAVEEGRESGVLPRGRGWIQLSGREEQGERAVRQWRGANAPALDFRRVGPEAGAGVGGVRAGEGFDRENELRGAGRGGGADPREHG